MQIAQLNFLGLTLNDFDILLKIINENSSFLITAHVNPDADALGSQLAMYHLLKLLNKKVQAINHSKTPDNLKFLDKENVIQKYDPEKHALVFDKADVLIALDFNQSNRIVSMEKGFKESNAIKVCIDHHQNPGEFADYFFNSTSYSATGEIIYDFIKKTKIVELDDELALPIYAAIMTDTGSFKYERTTYQTHLIAAELLQYKVDPLDVYDKIYNQSNIAKVKLLGKALESMQLFAGGKICFMTIKQDMIKSTGAVESEIDGVVNFCMSVQGVKIGLLFVELKKGIKISYRSKGTIPVNKLAAEFDGGGHTNAAGSRLFNGESNPLIEKVLKAAVKYLD